jgi:hypothetical protein
MDGVVERIKGRKGWRGAGSLSEGSRRLEWSVHGELRFATGLGRLEWPPHRPGWLPQGAPALSPWTLVESVASCVTLFTAILKFFANRQKRPLVEVAGGGLLLTGIKGWCLGPGRPGSPAYDLEKWCWQPPYPYEMLESATGVLRGDEFGQQPHRLAWILLSQLYEDFGYESAAIPFYNAKEARFEFEP